MFQVIVSITFKQFLIKFKIANTGEKSKTEIDQRKKFHDLFIDTL